jgi:uncharacterized membrane protein
MNGQITTGGIYSRGFELFRKSYKKLLLVAAIMFMVNITTGYLIQNITMPAQVCGMYAAEFSLFGVMSTSIAPSASDDWSFSYGDDGNLNSFSDIPRSDTPLPGIGAAVAWGIFAAVLLLLLLFYMAIVILNTIISGTFGMGAKQASVVLAEGGMPSLDGAFGFFGKNWRRCLGVTAWVTLWTVLWGLLFIVPGFVKGYSYRLAPYLVIQYPELTVRQALRKSIEITRGHKGKLFVLDLTLWAIGLCALLASCCFYFLPTLAASLFLISPLGYALFAEAYVEIKQEAAGKGLLITCEPQPPEPQPAE